MDDTAEEYGQFVRRNARERGFDRVGIAAVDEAEEAEDFERFLSWLDAGHAAEMDYLARSAARRRSVREIVPGARSVVVTARSYNYPAGNSPAGNSPAGNSPAGNSPAGNYPAGSDGSGDARISRYAGGRDYHKVVTRALKSLATSMADLGGNHRYYVDTGPVLERSWARRSGVGWTGKNTCTIHPELGSYFFLGVVITTLELAPDPPVPDHCGSCTRCLDACPTDAFVEPYVLDSRRCIAYWNVEHRGEFPPGIAPSLGPHAFGCDICQEVCPWNREDRTARPLDDELAPVEARRARQDALELVRQLLDDASVVTRGSSMSRAKRQGLLRNVAAVLANLRRADARPELERMAGDEDPVVAGAAREALARLASFGSTPESP